MKHNGPNDSAFPCAYPDADNQVVAEGLTVREWFAGQALIGLMSNSDLPDLMKGFVPSKAAAEICFMVADAMIQESRTQRDSKGEPTS